MLVVVVVVVAVVVAGAAVVVVVVVAVAAVVGAVAVVAVVVVVAVFLIVVVVVVAVAVAVVAAAAVAAAPFGRQAFEQMSINMGRSPVPKLVSRLVLESGGRRNATYCLATFRRPPFLRTKCDTHFGTPNKLISCKSAASFPELRPSMRKKQDPIHQQANRQLKRPCGQHGWAVPSALAQDWLSWLFA